MSGDMGCEKLVPRSGEVDLVPFQSRNESGCVCGKCYFDHGGGGGGEKIKCDILTYLFSPRTNSVLQTEERN